MRGANKNLLLKEDLARAVKNHAMGRLAEAEELYHKILRIQPSNEVALNSLAVIANQAGKHDIACGLCQKALSMDSTNEKAHNSMGIALAGLGRPEEAIASYRLALRLNPHYPEALYNIGLELEKTGRSADAILALQEAIRIHPNSPDAFNALGVSLYSQGRSAQAIESFQMAIKLRPTYFFAFNNLANTLSAMDRLEEALPCYQEAVRLNPNYCEAFNNMGNALARLGRIDQAITAFSAALAIEPDFAASRSSLSAWKLSACDWTDLEADEEAFLKCVRTQPWAIDPFYLLAQNSTPADQLLCARSFAKRSSVPPSGVFLHPRDQSARKIRLGYISGDFRQHPSACLAVGLFEQHDRERFAVIGYSYGLDDHSDIRQRVEKSFDHFFDIRNLTHAEAAAKIRADGIDVLIDHQGYTVGHRLGILAFRPAPIQVNYLGFSSTMGASCIDYIIADPFVVPMEEQPFFTEKIVHLPHCYQSNDHRQVIAPVTPARGDCGLPENGFVFCCFNSPNKIRPVFFDIWMRLLKDVPGSVLWLLEKNTLVKDNLSREAATRGIDPNRLVFAPPVSHAEHLARHRLADLFLDTLPFNAHTTASDALWAELPLITCVGQTFTGRVAGSILRAIGLPELVTTSLPDYEALAMNLARKPETLAKIRQKLQENRLTTPLFDTSLYTRHLEDAYTRMWKLWQSGRVPESMVI